MSENNEEGKFSFIDFLKKYFPEAKGTPNKVKKNGLHYSNDKNLPVQEKLEKLKEEQMKIINSLNKQSEKNANKKKFIF